MSVGPTPPVGGLTQGPLVTGQAAQAAIAPTRLAQAPDPVSTLMQTAVTAARAEAAIRQSGQGPLLANLQAALASPNLPAHLKAAIRQVLSYGLNAGAGLDAAALRAAVARSGLFLEARLAQAAGSPPGDMKAALLGLQQALVAAGALPGIRPARASPPPPARGAPVVGQAARAASLRLDDPPEVQLALLREETEQALARQTLHQLASLPDEGPGRWIFELPLLTPQGQAIAQFAIDRDDPPAGAPEAAPTWRARFALDIDPLGPVTVHLRLQAGRSSAVLWVERPDSLAQLQAQAQELSAALSGDVVFQRGAPPAAQAPAPGALVDRSS
jgi:hypothetical protein